MPLWSTPSDCGDGQSKVGRSESETKSEMGLGFAGAFWNLSAPRNSGRCLVTCSVESQSGEGKRGEMSTPQVKVLYSDDWFVVVDKPAGLLVHRNTKLDKHASRFVKDEAAKLLPGRELYTVHRLDRPTSGVLVFALDRSVNAASLQEVMGKSSCVKEYTALCKGLTPPSWSNTNPLTDYDSKKRVQREAHTDFETLAWYRDANDGLESGMQTSSGPDVKITTSLDVSLVRAVPRTGRRHQIRRHLSHERHPILGDTEHGKGRDNRFVRSKYNLQRLFLHAATLSFEHPATNELVQFHSPLPEDLSSVLRQLLPNCETAS